MSSKMNRGISGAFVGGVMGALVAGSSLWALGKIGISARLGIGLQPDLAQCWLYPRLIWGGLFGLLLLLPMLSRRLLLRGILIGLAPAAMILFHLFPQSGKGMFGLGYGQWTPVVILLLTSLWGMVASLWYSSVR